MRCSGRRRSGRRGGRRLYRGQARGGEQRRRNRRIGCRSGGRAGCCGGGRSGSRRNRRLAADGGACRRRRGRRICRHGGAYAGRCRRCRRNWRVRGGTGARRGRAWSRRGSTWREVEVAQFLVIHVFKLRQGRESLLAMSAAYAATAYAELFRTDPERSIAVRTTRSQHALRPSSLIQPSCSAPTTSPMYGA